MHPTKVSAPDVKAITVFLASTATPERGGLPYLDAVLPAEDRLAATRVVRDLGALPPDAILYLLAQALLDLASDHLLRDRDLTAQYEERFEVENSDEWIAAMAEYNREADAITAAVFRARGEAGLARFYLRDRRGFRPPNGARPATLLRAANRRTRRLSAVEGNHRLTVSESRKTLRAFCSPSLPSSSPWAFFLYQNPRTGLFQPIADSP